MHFANGLLEQRLQSTRRKILIRKLTSSLLDSWFLFLTFAVIWISGESLLSPKTPLWVSLSVLGSCFLISTLGAIAWTFRAYAGVVLRRVPKK
jgi:hypothetical protein